MKYISLLRGINVSGQKIIKMNELKSIYMLLGFQNVVTYIQSGNVIFDSSNKNGVDLKNRIINAIEKKYKFHVPVEIRTKIEFANIIKNHPFRSIDTTENGK